MLARERRRRRRREGERPMLPMGEHEKACLDLRRHRGPGEKGGANRGKERRGGRAGNESKRGLVKRNAQLVGEKPRNECRGFVGCKSVRNSVEATKNVVRNKTSANVDAVGEDSHDDMIKYMISRVTLRK